MMYSTPDTRKTRTGSVYPSGTSTVAVKITLSQEEYRACRKLGNGYVTHGIRGLIQSQGARALAAELAAFKQTWDSMTSKLDHLLDRTGKQSAKEKEHG